MYDTIKQKENQGLRRGYDDIPELIRPTSADAAENTVIAFFIYDAGATKENIVEYAHKILDAAKPDEYKSEVISSIIAAERKSITDNNRLLTLSEMLSVDNAIADRKNDILRDFGTLEGAVISAEQVHQRALTEKKINNTQQYAFDLKNARTREERQQAEADHRRRMEELDSDEKSNVSSLNSVLVELLNRLERGEELTPKFTTGFSRLDLMLDGGYGAGHLIVLAARPSVGKSAFMTDSATRLAQAGVPSLILSLEMDKNEIMERIIKQRTDTLFPPTQDEIKRPEYTEQMSRIINFPIDIFDGPASLEEIESQIAKATRCGKNVIFIDYAGQIKKPDNMTHSADQVVFFEDVTARLKQSAKKHGVAVVLLAQLNRESAKTDAAPTLAGLRSSGGFEQTADDVLALWNPMPDNKDTRQMIVLKNRYGATGKIDFAFHDSRCRFTEVIIATETFPDPSADCLEGYESGRFAKPQKMGTDDF